MDNNLMSVEINDFIQDYTVIDIETTGLHAKKTKLLNFLQSVLEMGLLLTNSPHLSNLAVI